MPHYSEEKTHIYFDVDDTLLLWGYRANHPKAIEVPFPYPWGTGSEFLIPHEDHIAALKEHKAKGRVVVVWSAGGAAWAQAAVKALKLEAHVDFVLAKPDKYYDDLACCDFMGFRGREYTRPGVVDGEVE